MKTKLLLTAFVSSFIVHASAFAQGALAPTGAPAPTMKSLAQIEPRKPISALPANLTVSGSYYLTANLTGSGGITINSSDTTLDLGGFAITGGASAGDAITLNGALKNVVIRNGAIRGWSGSGVLSSSSSARNLVFEHLNIYDCVDAGIWAYNAVISDCTISGLQYDGINAYTCIVRNCSVSGCNSVGIYLAGGTVSHCQVSSCGLDGIFVNASGCVVNDNLIQGNNTGNDSASYGILVGYSNNRIENNQVIGNGAAGGGIMVKAGYPGNPVITGNLVIKNFVSGNGANNYNLSALTISGPIISATGTIGSSNPWANFSY